MESSKRIFVAKGGLSNSVAHLFGLTHDRRAMVLGKIEKI